MVEFDLKYFNEKQIEAMCIGANKEIIIGSRGFGKSEGIDALRLLRNVQHMPRSKGGLISPTYTKLLQNTLPAICHALERLGYYQDVHYVIGKNPPKHFIKPYQKPKDFSNIMSWYNGSILQFISLDGKMSSNSMSFDYVLGFEAKFLNYKRLKDEVFPSIRGGVNHFGNCPWHHGWVFTSDMPTQSGGMWLLDKQKECDYDLIEVIKALYEEKKSIELKLRANPDSEFHQREFNRVSEELNTNRKNALFYAEYNVFDNIKIFTIERLEALSKELSPLEFRTSILNQRARKVSGGFYASMSDSLHTYTPPNSPYMDKFGYDFKQTTNINCLHDGDIDETLPLNIGCDYNSAINTIVTAQRIGNEARTLSSMFVKSPLKLSDAVQQWCNYYAGFKLKEVVYYYDHTSVVTSAATDVTFKDIVVDILKRNGWFVKDVYIGQAAKHNLKYEWINQGLSANPEYLFPTFNKYNNEYLILAMQLTKIYQGKNGFEKDKTLEKHADSPDNPDELKTHITDAWDTTYIGINFHYPATIHSYIPEAQSWK